MNKQICIILFILTCSICNAQKYDYNWVFDDSIGIDFNNLAAPIVFNPIMHGGYDENHASISDSSGNLLFYINDNFSFYHEYSCIYNKFYQIMDNGDSIPSYRTTTQGTLIIPFINDTNKYYLIYLNTSNLTSYSQGLYYAVVDMSMNNDSGKVISKNNLLINGSLTEKLTAIKHGNGSDWWIFTHDFNNSNIFYSFLLTSTGFSSLLQQSIGSLSTATTYNGYQGQIIFIWSYPGSVCI